MFLVYTLNVKVLRSFDLDFWLLSKANKKLNFAKNTIKTFQIQITDATKR